jgi:membrane protein YqaA with SNARE-associated domain
MQPEQNESLREQYTGEVTGLVQKAGDLLRSRYGLWFLGIFSFADSALGLPVSMDPFLVAFIVANRKKTWFGYALVVAGSVLGGIFAYFFTSYIIQNLFSFLTPELAKALHVASRTVNKGAFVFSFLSSFSPLPYTLVAVAAGVLKVNVFAFIAGSILGRTIRYGIVAFPTYFLGEKAVTLAKRHALVTVLVFVVLIGMYLLFGRHHGKM